MPSKPSRETRNRMIDEYLSAVDSEEFERYREIFDADVEFISMGDTAHDIEAMIDWYESLGMTNFRHDYGNRVHDGSVSIAYGNFRGDLSNDASIEGKGLNLFEFNDDETAITKMIIFTSLKPHV